jgi:hypothetical protein
VYGIGHHGGTVSQYTGRKLEGHQGDIPYATRQRHPVNALFPFRWTITRAHKASSHLSHHFCKHRNIPVGHCHIDLHHLQVFHMCKFGQYFAVNMNGNKMQKYIKKTHCQKIRIVFFRIFAK